MLVSQKTSIYFSVELGLREIPYVMYVHALITTRSSARV